MVAILRSLLFALCLGAAFPALATSIVRAPPHDPAAACATIKELIDALVAGRRANTGRAGYVTLFSDDFGKVEGEAETAAFLATLRDANGKPDRRPLQLYHAYTMRSDEGGASYLVVIERESWTPVRATQDDMLMWTEVPDPHYETSTSYWIATFRSNALWEFREAGELYRFVEEERQLAGC